MSRSIMINTLGVLFLITVAGLVFRTVTAEEAVNLPAKPQQPDQELRDFMRKKLEASSQILEGLALEDHALIKQGAEALAKMSTTEKWHISKDVMYRQFSNEFQRNAEKLVDAANDKNINRAALRWMDATMSCIECHRFVRNDLVVQAKH